MLAGRSACPAWYKRQRPMGEVVQLDTPADGEQEQRAARTRRRRRRQSKTALVLGGGGFTGGVYEIGALRALDLLAVNQTVNEFDVYVGTSAGSFVASLLANGVTPEEMMRVLNPNLALAAAGHGPQRCCCGRTTGASPRRRSLFPFRLAGMARELAGRVGEISVDGRLSTASPPACRTASTTAAGIERYVAEVARRPRSHRRLPDARAASSTSPRPTSTPPSASSSARASGPSVPISTAVAASSALPLVYDAGRDQGPRVHRRRHPLDDERRHRGRARRQVHRRRQPDRPVRQRLQQADADDLRRPRPAGLRHGLRRDRQPGVPHHRPRPPAPRRRGLGGNATPASTSS